MNTLESFTTGTPDGNIGECSRFTVEDVTIPFTLHDIMTQEQQYALSLWTKLEVETEEETVTGSLLVRGATMTVTSEWTNHSHIFIANKTDLDIYFGSTGVYYIYHPQLERGNVATDWSESPLDTDKKIKDAKDTADAANKGVQELYIKLEDSIQMVVQAINNGTLLEQTEDGWNFVGGGTTDQLLALSNALKDLTTETNDSITQLRDMISENDKLASYVQIDESGEQPVIRMGVYITDAETGEGSFGKFSIQITNTAIEFLADGDPIAWLSNQELHIKKAVIEEELAVGGFVLKQHGSRNNVGFLWKGVTS